MDDIRLIAAVGRHRQIGFCGLIPWDDPEDGQPFRRKTQNGIILMGQRSANTVDLHKVRQFNRVVAVLSSSSLTSLDASGELVSRPGEDWLDRPGEALSALTRDFPGRTIWVAGGAIIFREFAPYCSQFDITLVDYDGKADAWLPPLPFEAPPVRDGVAQVGGETYSPPYPSIPELMQTLTEVEPK